MMSKHATKSTAGRKDGRVRGVLLDVDGTLLESNDAHAKAWVEAFEGAGLSLPFSLIREKIGKGGDKVLWEVAGLEEGSPQAEVITSNRKHIFRTLLPNVGPTPGARELLLRMKAEGLAQIVATSAAKDELEGLLAAAGVADLIEQGARVTADDAKRSKPDPDIIRAAVERANVPQHELVMLGDTPYDVQAAKKAGVATIALRSGGWSDADLAGAIAIYDDPADLLAHYDASPLMQTLPADVFRGAPSQETART